MSNRLKDVMQRAESWPEADQELAADILLAVEAEHADPVTVSVEDAAALDRSAEDVRLGRFASDAAVKSIFDRYR